MKFEIKLHKVLKDWTAVGVGRNGRWSYRRISLQYDPKLWEGAACAGLDTNMFFPHPTETSDLYMKPFRKMCVDCPAMQACLEWAVVHERHGIWAGTNENERIRIRRHAGIACCDIPTGAIS